MIGRKKKAAARGPVWDSGAGGSAYGAPRVGGYQQPILAPSPFGAGPAPAPAVAVAVEPAGGPADWLADPTGHHELRYWDGTDWTEHVSDDGDQGVDPLT